MAQVNTDEPKSSGGSGPAPASAYSHPYRANNVTSTDLITRKGSSVILMVLLYTAATPFSPITWFVDMPGTWMLDRLFAGFILFIAIYFQWRIASLTSVVYVHSPSVDGGRQTLRNGRLEASGGGEIMYMWQPSNYWPFALCEFFLLCVAEYYDGPFIFGYDSDFLRKAIIFVVLGGLWTIGWAATPQGTKTWAWEQIKGLMFWMILNEIMSSLPGGVGSNPRMRRARQQRRF
ncbi:hypothetical protein MKZ38_003640 [Zalerion maritima]|uniref:Uncharacterized protein n=1 Tax=Zalerion maritima TaxID=339359 RepID=A0AAD5RN78_9PEZI|nr:hypothetical protein MKZ38_003640 [Zalerion maritima]